jgi:hypothetical protein
MALENTSIQFFWTIFQTGLNLKKVDVANTTIINQNRTNYALNPVKKCLAHLFFIKARMVLNLALK